MCVCYSWSKTSRDKRRKQAQVLGLSCDSDQRWEREGREAREKKTQKRGEEGRAGRPGEYKVKVSLVIRHICFGCTVRGHGLTKLEPIKIPVECVHRGGGGTSVRKEAITN